MKNLGEIFVSPDYVVFPDDTRTVAANGPFVRLVFSPAYDVKGKLVVQRGEETVGRVEIPGKKEPVFLLENVSRVDNYIEWYVENENKSITHRGVLGLPMSGALPELVHYEIRVDSKHKAN